MAAPTVYSGQTTTDVVPALLASIEREMRATGAPEISDGPEAEPEDEGVSAALLIGIALAIGVAWVVMARMPWM